MKIRSSDREPPGRAAGMVGTLLIHAAAVGFLLGTVKPSKALTMAIDSHPKAKVSVRLVAPEGKPQKVKAH